MWPLSFVSLLIFLSRSSLSHLPVSKSSLLSVLNTLSSCWPPKKHTHILSFCFLIVFFSISISLFVSPPVPTPFLFFHLIRPVYCYCLSSSLPACLTLHLSVSLNTGFCMSMCLSLCMLMSCVCIGLLYALWHVYGPKHVIMFTQTTPLIGCLNVQIQ